MWVVRDRTAHFAMIMGLRSGALCHMYSMLPEGRAILTAGSTMTHCMLGRPSNQFHTC